MLVNMLITITPEPLDAHAPGPSFKEFRQMMELVNKNKGFGGLDPAKVSFRWVLNGGKHNLTPTPDPVPSAVV